MTQIPRLLKLLPLFHAASLLAVLLQPTSPAILFGRYSRTSLVLLVLLTLSLPVVIWGTRWLARQFERDRIHLSLRVCVIVLAVSALLSIVFGGLASRTTSSDVVLAIYALAVVLIATFAALLQSRKTSLPLINPRGVLFICLLLACFLLLLVTRFPGQLWTDEGYNTGLALAIARGQFAVPFFRLAPELNGPNYSLTYVALAGVYRVFGVNLAYGRLLIYAVGLLSLFLSGVFADFITHYGLRRSSSCSAYSSLRRLTTCAPMWR